MSKTEGVLLNLIGHKLDDDPGPILYIGPTQKNVESIAGTASEPRTKGRVGTMIRTIPSLYAGLLKGKDEKITEKWVNGSRLGFGWAGSATELASNPAALGLLDEYDRMRPIPGEGDPWGLLDARTSTYPDGCVVITSTPLEGLAETYDPGGGLIHWKPVDPDDLGSPTWAAWQSGTSHEWAWPCPDCGDYFIPRQSLLWYPEGATPPQALRQSRLTCPNCGSQIEDRSKRQMNAAGRAVAPGQSVSREGEISGPEPEGDSAGLWVSGLCSPWRTFGQRAAKLITAERSGDPDKIRVAINTGFGELYAYRGDAPPWTRVRDHEGRYPPGAAPGDVLIITAGVDVQGDRLVYVVRGWARGLTSYLIERGELWGDTEKPVPGMPDPWKLLGALLLRNWGGDERPLYILRAMVDSGYHRDQVYRFCRQHPTQAVPIKGQPTATRHYWPSKQDYEVDGKLIKDGIVLWNLADKWTKGWVHGRLDEGWMPDQAGYWWVHQDIDEDYCRQIVAEAPDSKGNWTQISKINHFLDCEGYAFASMMSIGGDQELLAEDLATIQAQAEEPRLQIRRR